MYTKLKLLVCVTILIVSKVQYILKCPEVLLPNKIYNYIPVYLQTNCTWEKTTIKNSSL